MRSGKWFLTVAAIVCFGMPCFADDSLIAWWPLDGTADDVSGSGLHGTLMNGGMWAADGYLDRCVSLDGVDDYVDIPGYQGLAGTASRTCTAWIKTTHTPGEILAWGEDYPGGRWVIRVNEGGQLRAEVQGGNIIGTTLINDNTWHHVAVVLEDDGSPNITEARLYVDGKRETVSSAVEEPVNTGSYQTVHIGMYYTGQRYFEGLIDDVRIYDGALSASEVLGLYANFTGGSGTAQDPYQIASPEQLIAIGSAPALLSKHYVLIDDIVFDPNQNPAHVFTGALIAPYVDSGSPAFTGSFDGSGHTIENLKIVSSGDDYIGLFGKLAGTDAQQTVVQNLTLVNPRTSGGRYYGGALAGWMEGCKVRSCHVFGGLVDHDALVGGLVGAMDYAMAENCSSTAGVYGTAISGGFAGGIGASTIIDCTAGGEVSSSGPDTGGLVGWMWGGYSSDLPGAGDRIINCHATGRVESDAMWCGGLVGSTQKGIFEKCSASGRVDGAYGVGGLIGYVESRRVPSIDFGPVELLGCYAAGDVQGTGSSVGGLVGRSQALIVKDCYASGNVTSTGSSVGGLIGTNDSLVARCFSTGRVTGDSPARGLIGKNAGTVFLSFWDTQTSEKPGSDGGTGKTTAEMTVPKTYRGWGDDAWVLDAGRDYPHLAWEGTPGILIVDEKPYPGSGTHDDPYRIGSADEFLAAGWYIQDWDKHFSLVDDIELDPDNLNDPNVIDANTNFNKLGFEGFPFTGYFNGQFHVISNLVNQTINAEYNGLFGFVRGDGPEDVVVENLRIVGPIFAGRYAHGGLAGGLENGKITRCGVEEFTLLGLADDDYGINDFGGLVGFAENAAISMCYADNGMFDLGSRSLGYKQGGLVGSLHDTTVNNSYAAAVFHSAGYMDGGFVGYAYNSTLYHCYAVPTWADSTGESLAGFVGECDTTPNRCYFLYSDYINTSDGGIGLWDEEMKQQSRFSLWDFVGENTNGENEIWRMCVDGMDYPRLSWEFARRGDFACGDGAGMPDLAAIAENWLTSTTIEPVTFNYACDANGDEEVTLSDLAVLSRNYTASFEVSTHSLSFSAYADGDNPDDKTFTIINGNIDLLNWSIDTAALPQWLTITPASGCLNLNNTEEVVLSLDITDLVSGEYSYSIEIIDASTELSETITVYLAVTGSEIRLWRTNMSFQGYEAGSNPSSQQFAITNGGGGMLNWNIDTTVLPDWLSIDNVGGTLLQNEDDFVTVMADLTGLRGGEYSYELEIFDTIASNNPQRILVLFEVIGPQLLIEEPAFKFRGYLSEVNPVDHPLVITNTGGGTLNWTVEIVDKPNWLTIASAGGNLMRNDSSSVPLFVDISGLPIGLYSYSFQVVDPNASSSPQIVNVILTVGADNLSVPDDFSIIQTAIDAVKEGGTVTVSPGIYFENIYFNGKNCILTSTDPNDTNIVESTIIDGNALGTVVTFDFDGTDTDNCVLRGLTITNGTVSDISTMLAGGIDGRSSTKAIMEKCIIKDNIGRGVSNYHGYIKNCVISNNSGGLYSCHGTISNCVINNNISSYGGGLHSCNGTIENCVINGNLAGNYGGGLFRCTAVIRGCIISNNSASSYGGGLSQCWTSAYWNPPSISNCLIIGNFANRGSGVHSSTIPISNCILWGNTDNLNNEQIINWSDTPTYSCVQNWTGGGEGNVSSDPLFADVSSADPADWDLHLQVGSPCIDAGTNTPTGGLPASDLDGNPRIVDGDGNADAIVDMGAYEYQP